MAIEESGIRAGSGVLDFSADSAGELRKSCDDAVKISALSSTNTTKAIGMRIGLDPLRVSAAMLFRNKSSNQVPFPHPKPGKDNYGNGDIPNQGGVIWNLFERTINITDYRDGKNDVNPAKNRAFRDVIHD
jgi:hypothetical protein